MQYVKIKFYFLGLDGFIFYLDKHFHHHDKLEVIHLIQPQFLQW